MVDNGSGATADAPAGRSVEPALEPRWLSDVEQAAWLGAAALVFTVPAVLDSRLQRDAGLGLFEYMVLSSLSMSPERTRRMSELAELTHGSLSRLSNVVKRLEQREWVRRHPDPIDGRYTVAVLTDAGWDKVVATAPGHVRDVRHLVLEPLTGTQIRQLGDIGQRIRTRAQAQPAAGDRAENACEPTPPC